MDVSMRGGGNEPGSMPGGGDIILPCLVIVCWGELL